MNTKFSYKIGLEWQGSVNVQKNYRYNKTYLLQFENKPNIIGSADATFHGDKDLYNPEEMLLSALASCHMMSFFYLCSKEKIILHSYKDNPIGILKINTNGSGQFETVTLKPKIKVETNTSVEKIEALFSLANEYCFIARSCNFKIIHQPEILF